MGLAFTESEPDQQNILDRWISELSGDPIAGREPGTSKGDLSAQSEESAPKASDSQPTYVVHELVVLLLQKGVLTESEGKSLIQKLLK